MRVVHKVLQNPCGVEMNDDSCRLFEYARCLRADVADCRLLFGLLIYTAQSLHCWWTAIHHDLSSSLFVVVRIDLGIQMENQTHTHQFNGFKSMRAAMQTEFSFAFRYVICELL